MKFFHEAIVEKEQCHKEEMAKFNKAKAVYDLGYDVEEELKLELDQDLYWYGPGFLPTSYFINIYTSKRIKSISNFINRVFDLIDPICEEHGFELDTNKTKKYQERYELIWRLDPLQFEVTINIKDSCTRIVVGTTEKYDYICKGD